MRRRASLLHIEPLLSHRAEDRTDALRRVRDFYDSEASLYINRRPWMKTYVQERAAQLMDEFEGELLGDNGFTLVIGTGPGWLEEAHPHRRFISLDLSMEMARVSNLKNHHADTIVASAEFLPLRSRSIPRVVASRSIKYLDIQRLLIETKRILKKNGTFLVIYDCGDVFWVGLVERIHRTVDPGLMARTLRTAELNEALSNMGLGIGKSGTLTVLPLSWLGRLPKQILPFIEFLDQGWHRGRLSYVFASERS